jgi:hypothetical protein
MDGEISFKFDYFLLCNQTACDLTQFNYFLLTLKAAPHKAFR